MRSSHLWETTHFCSHFCCTVQGWDIFSFPAASLLFLIFLGYASNSSCYFFVFYWCCTANYVNYEKFIVLYMVYFTLFFWITSGNRQNYVIICAAFDTERFFSLVYPLFPVVKILRVERLFHKTSILRRIHAGCWALIKVSSISIHAFQAFNITWTTGSRIFVKALLKD